ncbi:hypothetical protein PAMP_009410 [Pampus punctatissimus]
MRTQLGLPSWPPKSQTYDHLYRRGMEPKSREQKIRLQGGKKKRLLLLSGWGLGEECENLASALKSVLSNLRELSSNILRGSLQSVLSVGVSMKRLIFHSSNKLK